LLAAIAPVVVGTGLALASHHFRLLPALAALFGAVILQIGVNLANDYFDYVKGVDTTERLGPIRVTQSGLIAPARVRAGLAVTMGLALAVGVYLVLVGGWPILTIGLASICAALTYSGGPYPLASHGLGEVFVFIFFGLVAVCGTYYVQALSLTIVVVTAAVPVGLLITAILVVNNLRDIQTDRRAGKYTLAVILGIRRTRIEYVLLLAGAYAVPVTLWLTDRMPAWVILPLASMPLAVRMAYLVIKNEGPILNQALAGTARLALVFSLLLSAGLILSARL
jgi:1,4-dihydroxy-2-naphthoate octaprenyltransferase